jgi:putative membrane protein
MQQVDFSRPRSVREFLRLYLTGFAMGAADIVPGVSGGTMAFILGIYETLLNAIKSFDLTALRLALGLKFKELFEHIPFGFLIALGLGILTAIVTLSNLLGTALETQPALVFAFFGGLVLASIVAIGIKLKWTVATIIALVIGAVFAFVLVGLNPLEDADHTPVVLFFAGMVAIMAMILPGISGSFILLILGQYAFVLNAVRSFDIISVGALALGCVVGIVLFARVLSWLLHNYEQVTIAALVGFMIGSLRKIWIEVTAGGTREFESSEIALALVLIIVGFILVSFLDHLQTRSNPVFSLRNRSRSANEIDPAL